MSKRGQFYLVSAIILAVIIVGITAITNYTQTASNVKLYDLKNELQIESAKVLDYGTYNELNDTQMSDLLDSFINDYISSQQNATNLYFIYGNKDKIKVIASQDLANEVSVSGIEGTVGYLTLDGSTASGEFTPQPPYKVNINIGTDTYSFKLKEGENFYFIISQNSTSGTNVVTN